MPVAKRIAYPLPKCFPSMLGSMPARAHWRSAPAGTGRARTPGAREPSTRARGYHAAARLCEASYGTALLGSRHGVSAVTEGERSLAICIIAVSTHGRNLLSPVPFDLPPATPRIQQSAYSPSARVGAVRVVVAASSDVAGRAKWAWCGRAQCCSCVAGAQSATGEDVLERRCPE
eukprot:5634969-Pleurochrysis_carterae.AAC.1